MVLDHHSSELDSHWGVDANNAEREGHRGNSLLRFLVTTTSQQLPRQYFRLRIRRDPVAPVSSLLWGYSFEVILSTAALAVLLWYYASNGGAPFPLTTEIVNTVKEAGMGWTCKVLSPKKGTVYYSTLNSENAQFASPYENYLDVAQCKATLTKNGVCNDGLRYDHLSVLGVTNTNNSQYYTHFGPLLLHAHADAGAELRARRFLRKVRCLPPARRRWPVVPRHRDDVLRVQLSAQHGRQRLFVLPRSARVVDA